MLISKEIKAPVQVVWTREDDMTQGPFRPGAVYQCKGGINGERISALQIKLAGKTVEKNFDTYKMPRINEIPVIDIHVMDNDEKPGGAGEPALPTFAPALCNAIFDLTGKRIRKLPFKLGEV